MDFAAYLRHEQIVVDDPYEQKNLRPKEKVSVGARAVAFENYYQVIGDRIFCHICGGHRHLNGITGILDDGTRLLFGKKCAEGYFGREVTKHHFSALRRKRDDASARFKILTIKAQIEPISIWLESYRSLTANCSERWVEIRSKLEKPFLEITSELQKNNGRIVKREVEELQNPDGSVRRMFNDKILTSIRNPEAIPYLTQLSQQLSFVDIFISSVNGLQHEPDQQIIRNLNRLFKRMLDAANTIDGCLAFTHDFFRPEKLSIMSDWAANKRSERLGNPTETTKREVGKLFQKIMGSGFPLPPKRLSDTILEIDALADIKAGELAKSRSLQPS